MDWKGRRESENIDDRRMLTPRLAAVGRAGVIFIALLTFFCSFFYTYF